jgi:hypothetical protein
MNNSPVTSFSRLIATLLGVTTQSIAIHPVFSQNNMIRANCGKGGIVALEISNERVEREGTPSMFNLSSSLKLDQQDSWIKGSTSIFYAGQSTWFSSFDDKIIFNATRGHGANREIDSAELKTERGTFSCIFTD